MSGALATPALDTAEEAAAHVAAGGLLAFPTETVWGLGADARSAEAVARLFAWKGRGPGQPVSVLVADLDAAEALGIAPTPAARALARAFWPGPLTLVVPAPRARLAPGVARDDGAVGLRCSPDPTAAALARALARAGAGPLTATSLNRAGEPPAADLDAARALCRRHPGPVLLAPISAAPVRSGAAPSTVVDCTGPAVRVLRAGAIADDAVLRAAAGPGRPDGPDPANAEAPR